MYTILICDDNTDSLEGLRLAINKEPQFTVVAEACDGKAAIASIEKFHPDIIILDIVMPEYDGIYIVNYVRKSMRDYVPIVYILSGFGTDPIVRALNELGVDFYSMKPVPLHVIIRNLNALIKQRDNAGTDSDPTESSEKSRRSVEQESLENIIRDLLLRLGVMPHRISSKCIIDALIIYMYDTESSPILTKVLYPQVAEKRGLNNSSVEKNIRSSISQMQREKTELYSEVFSYAAERHITNGEFLSVMSDYIKKHMFRGEII